MFNNAGPARGLWLTTETIGAAHLLERSPCAAPSKNEASDSLTDEEGDMALRLKDFPLVLRIRKKRKKTKNKPKESKESVNYLY